MKKPASVGASGLSIVQAVLSLSIRHRLFEGINILLVLMPATDRSTDCECWCGQSLVRTKPASATGSS